MRTSLVLLVFLIGFTCGVNENEILEASNKIIREDERRGTNSDNVQTDSKKRSLFSLTSFGGGNHHHQSPYPSGYDSSGPGYGGSGHGYGGHSGYGGSYGPPSAHGYDQEEYGHSGPGYGGYGGNYGHVQHGGGGHSGLYLKKLLIPLAGIALLGAAAALSTNPVLLQLGVVNGRKRRSLHEDLMRNVYPANPNIKPNS